MKPKCPSRSGVFGPRILVWIVLCAAGVFLALIAFGVYPGGSVRAQAPQPNQDPGRKPGVVQMVGPYSLDQDLRTLPYIPPNEEKEEVRLMRHPQTYSQGIPDPLQAVRRILGPTAMPTPIATFDGMNSVQSACSCLPPDPNGDVGPSHYVQSVNLSIKIFDKRGTALNGANGTTYNSLFSAMGPATPCGDKQNQGYGVVLYDHLADRWVVSDTAFPAFPGTSFYQCIGVSKTADPVAGGWWLYAVQIDPAHPTFYGDYPRFGLWSDAYYFSVNLFSTNTTFNGVRVFALDRSAMINGTGVPDPGAIAFTISPATLGDTYSLVPATFSSASLAPTVDEYFMAINSPAVAGTVETQVKSWRFHVDFAKPANSVFGLGSTHMPNGTTIVDGFVDAFSTTTRIVPQKGTSARLDTLGDRLMAPLVYQNLGGTESLWSSHTVNNHQNGTGPTAIRWYQFDVTGGVIPASAAQQQTFSNEADGLWRWMPSISVDAAGNMAVGYSASSATSEPSIRYAGRLRADPVNLLAQGETTLFAGGGHQTNSSGRWADYSRMSIDPSDNLTFWQTNEYYPVTGDATWSTRIGNFKFPTGAIPTPTGTPTPTPTATDTPTATATVTPTATIIAGSTPTPTSTPTPSCAPIPAGMVSWWPLESNGNDIYGPNNGSLHNVPSFGPGKVNQAMSVTGNNGISVPSSPSLNFGANADLSIDAWIKTSEMGRNTLTIVDKRVISGANVTGYVVYLYNGKLGFQLGVGGSGQDAINLSGDLRDGQWHHVAITVARTSATGGKGYLDGVQTGTFNPTARSGNLTNIAALKIGEHETAPVASFIGEIDEVELFSRVISGAEVASIYHAGSTGKCPPAATLGNYPNTSIPLSTDRTITPGATPTHTTSITVSTSTNFKGKLEGDPMTGVVQVTNAHPAGTYTVTVTAFGIGGASTTKMFTLIVTTPVTCNPVAFAAGPLQLVQAPVAIAVGDFNRDGKQDLATVSDSEHGGAGLYILLGDGAGSFSAPTLFNQFFPYSSVAVGDFNGDGKQDLAVTSFSSVSIFLGNGAGSFGTATTFGVGNSAVSVAVGDFNNDGKQDLAVANQGSNNVSILLGDGAGSFSAATNFDVGSAPASVALGDFNGDGKQDLAVANRGSNNVSILLGDGAGSFSAATNFSVLARSLVVGDFNGDGWQDIAVTYGFVSILLGDGAGSFSAATNISARSDTLAVGDFNGDGRQDLAIAAVVAPLQGGDVSALLRGCCAPPPAGMVSWWPLEANGTDIFGSNSGTPQIGLSFFPGKVNLAMTVNGTNGISVPNSPSLNFGANADLSIDAWIKTSETARNTLTIVDKRLISGANVNGYVVYLFNGKLGFQLGVGGTGQDAINLSADLRDGQWHHIAITVARTSTTGGKAYVDGAQTGTFDPTARSGNLTNTQPFLIGEHEMAAIANFIGEIDEVELFSRAITGADVASIYNAGGTGKCPVVPETVLIPAGTFTMGNSVGDTDFTNANPVATTVSAFYIAANEVSLSQWQSVYNWAVGHGYTFNHAGAGKGPNHPVQTLDWYDMVKWCNARSEQAGITPVYYTNDAQTAVYKTGMVDVTNAQVKWSANGYRLPTEAEWEKAARGGLSGQRFPWGNTINENLANYFGDTNRPYDLGPNGYNAIYATGGFPYTSPVGSFVANGYGLNDMAGNVFERCWDWYGTPYAGGSDPHGPATGDYRVIRGGSWTDAADVARCAFRVNYFTPVLADVNFGFRVVQSSGAPLP